MEPVLRFRIKGDRRWMQTGSKGCGDCVSALSVSSLTLASARSSRLPCSGFLASFCKKAEVVMLKAVETSLWARKLHC